MNQGYTLVVSKKVAIVDSIGSNLASLIFALNRIGSSFEITDEIDVLNKASHIILPGVGAAKNAMTKLKQRKLIDEISKLTKPTLGICLGMQIFMDASDEDDAKCLGIISNTCRPFENNRDYPVPHMGWNKVRFNRDSDLTKNLKDDDYYYFVHSYYVPICTETIGVSSYPIEFSAVVQKDNFFGTQFHPEKSGLSGSKILQNFVSI
ncbi:MAG: imidazole glycerol phosphate synthase subunit HisH [Gammaproteobacteria bacterium]|nr:imidazole glycerol phosphate synthase subunit HisH [Gammaproteobacteria bacterium]OUT96316.1 MAG: imidazole glycerol phosphate synthase subunit HisH [Gammaproteobacteria bacterium TMED36]